MTLINQFYLDLLDAIYKREQTKKNPIFISILTYIDLL